MSTIGLTFYGTQSQIIHNIEQQDQPYPVLIGGETILLHDVGAVSSQVLKSVLAHLQNNTFSIGPWYIHVDSVLTSGEAIVRSLLLGQIDSTNYDIALNRVALLPNNYQGSVQLAQVLQQFDIQAIFVQSDSALMPLTFNWQAEDGSQIIVLPYQISDDIHQTIEMQKIFRPNGPFIWIQQVASDLTGEIDDNIINPVKTSLATFTQSIRNQLPDAYRPILTDAFHLLPLSHQSGRYSARISLKQELARLSALLTHHTEALLALSLNFGDVAFPEIQKSLLSYSWQLLLQNMSPKAFAGAVRDDTYDEMLLRNRKVEDNAQQIIEKALANLSGGLYQGEIEDEKTYLVVWNPHGHDVKQLVQVDLKLPKGLYPNILLSPTEEEHPFTWNATEQQIDFLADTPALGYAVYTLMVSDDKTADYNQKRAVAGRSIGSVAGESLGLVGGRLDWTFANGTVIDLLNYYDGGDAGDIWTYTKPNPDVVMKGNIVDVIQVEATPTYERLLFRNRMRIAPKLKNGVERVRGLRVLDLNTSASYHNGLQAIHFRTTFTNTAEDHRLRVHLRTGIDTDTIYTDTSYTLTEHTIAKDTPTGDLPVQSTIMLKSNKRNLAIFTKGLMAVEPIREDEQITLALTLLRSVNHLDKAEDITSSQAQILEDITSEFMIMPLGAHPNQADLARQSMIYSAPLKAFQYATPPNKMRHSFLKIESQSIVVTAVKPAQDLDGLIVRLRNTSSAEDLATITAERLIQRATHLTMAEKIVENLPHSENSVTVSVSAGQIKTILLQFSPD
ncbi:MAG: glycosyl hydrolase-related protein [Chloroflexota bacterium]